MLDTATKIAIARGLFRTVMAARRAVGLAPEVEVTRGAVRWALDLREGIDLSVYLLGAFEPRTVRAYARLVRPGDVVLDIGANIGAHTLPLARLAGPAGRVLAFEPTAWAFGKLARNMTLNPALAPRITALQLMLVADAGRTPAAELFSSWPLTDAGDVHAVHRGRLMKTDGAAAARLDDVLAQQGVTRVDFVKLDVDGHEVDVLRGAPDLLARLRPRIVVELSPYVHAEEGHRFEDLVALFHDAGYGFHRLGDGRALPGSAEDLRRVIPSGGSINALALPAARP